MRLVVMVPVIRDRVFMERLYLPLRELEANGHTVVWSESIAHALHAVRDTDLLVMTRPGDIESAYLIEGVQRRGAKAVVDIDDAVHVIPHRNPYYVVWGDKKEIIEQWRPILAENSSAFESIKWAWEQDLDLVVSLARGRRQALAMCLQQADLVTTSTPALAKFYLDLLSLKKVKVVPNMVSENEWQGIKKQDRQDGRIFARWGGSKTHQDNLEVIKQAMGNAMESCPDLDFECMGIGAAGDAIFSHLPKGRFLSHPPQSLDVYTRWLSEADIILAPSDGSMFSKCKSDIRVLQAGVMGIPVVASEATYGKTVREAGMGLVAQSSKLWARRLQQICNNEQERLKMGENGQRYVWSRRTYEKNFQKWADVYAEVL